MQRRQFLTRAAAGAIAAAGSFALSRAGKAAAAPASGTPDRLRLVPPAGKIPVAFLISEGATVIDFCGPWEVFQDVHVSSRGEDMDAQMPFELFTVSEKTEPIRASAGLRIIPDHSFENAPRPRVIVVPAQGGRSEAMFDWLRRASATADLTMSVCAGAFLLARAGLLAGKEATTHHDFTDRLASQYPDIKVRRGLRYVEGPRIATAGGLTSGIDLALRVVERYFGREVAETTARYMEYQSQGWKS